LIHKGFVVTQNFHNLNKLLILLGIEITVTRKATQNCSYSIS